MDKLVYDAELLPDGSMLVTEHITVTFNGTYEGYFISIPRGSTPLSDILVSENGVAYNFNPGMEYEPPGTFLIKHESDDIIIDWSIDATDVQRTFDVSYRVNDLVTVHDDVADFYRKFIGEKNKQDIGEVIVHLLLPPGAENFKEGEDIRIWGHGPLHGEVNFAGPREVVWQITNMPADEFLEGRVTMPVQLFPAIPAELKTGQNALSASLDEETGWADEATRERLMARLQIVFAMLVFMGTLVALFLLWLKHGKEFKPEFQRDYYRELPADYSPAEMSVLWNWGEVKTHDITATLMDMARRGYITIEQQLFEKKGLLGTRDVTTYLLALQKEQYEKDKNNLQPHERKLIDYLFATISEDNLTLYLYDIEQFSQKRSREFYDNFWLLWKDCLSVKGDVNKWFEGTDSKTRWIVFGIGVLFFIISILLINWEMVILGVSFLVNAFLISIIPQIYKRRSQPANEDLNKWKAFRRFLLHFSDMERHEIPSLIIWEHYLVYAVSLGVAREVMKQLEIVFPNLKDDNYRFGQHWYYGAAGLEMAGFSNHFENIGQSLERSVEVAEKTVRAAESRSSSGFGGGGGFSGGGGGGSGGSSYGGR
ncbi:MAG: DUF2207 domain-containing protein [Dethiobacteria bacterium]